MMKKVYWLGILLILTGVACSVPVVGRPIAQTEKVTLVTTQAEEAPQLTATAVVGLAPTETPVVPAPTQQEMGFQLLPSNSAGKWLLYDSPASVKVLLFDGSRLWVGSQGGGLVQWDSQTLTPVRYTQAMGFPLRTVNDLAFDAATGLLYAVGDSGLAIWDGSQWQQRSAEEIGFEAGSPLTAVAVESGGMLWIGAEESYSSGDIGDEPVQHGGGLTRGDWQTNTWEQFRAPDPLISNQVNDLLFDSKGNLWVASGQYYNEPTEGGVSFRDPAGNWSHWGLEHGADGYQLDRGLDGYAFGSLAVDPDGTLYAGSRRGVSWLRPGAETWSSTEAWDIRQLAVDSRGVLWAVGREGLFRLEGDTLLPIYQQTEADNYQGIAIDSQDDIWFGGPNGLLELSGGAVELRQVPSALPGLQVSDVAINGDGSVWVRSGGMVSRIIGERITHFEDEFKAVEAAYPWTGHDTLWTIAPEGTIWLMKDGAAWGYFGGNWLNVPLDVTAEESILDLKAGADGLLVLSTGNGLRLYIPGQGWSLASSPATEQGTGAISGLVMDAANRAIWGSNAYSFFFPGQVMRYDVSTQSWQVFGEQDGAPTDVPPDGVSLSPMGEVWAVGVYGQVAVYRDGAWQTILQSAQDLGVTGFAGIYFGQGNDLWLTTVDACGFEAVCITGLVYFDGANWQRFTAQNSGLVENWVNAVSVDAQGNAWLATQAGLQLAPFP